MGTKCDGYVAIGDNVVQNVSWKCGRCVEWEVGREREKEREKKEKE